MGGSDLWAWIQQHSVAVSIFAVAVSTLALVRSWRVQRWEWALEARKLASEAAASARVCIGLADDVKPCIDAVFSLNGMTDSGLHQAYLAQLERSRKFVEETCAFAKEQTAWLDSFLPKFGVAGRVGTLVSAVHHIRAEEKILGDMVSQFRQELFDARRRIEAQIPAPIPK